VLARETHASLTRARPLVLAQYMETPLHMAACAGELDALCMLLRRGVSLNKANDVRSGCERVRKVLRR
jgi:hypothetical protein